MKLWTRLQKNSDCECFPFSKHPSCMSQVPTQADTNNLHWQVQLSKVEEQTLPFRGNLLQKLLEKWDALTRWCGCTRRLGCPERHMQVTAQSHHRKWGSVRRTHPGGKFGGYVGASALAFCRRNTLTHVWILHHFSREGKASKLHNYAIVITKRRPN